MNNNDWLLLCHNENLSRVIIPFVTLPVRSTHITAHYHHDGESKSFAAYLTLANSSIMPFLIPAALALTSDVCILWLNRLAGKGGDASEFSTDEEHCESSSAAVVCCC